MLPTNDFLKKALVCFNENLPLAYFSENHDAILGSLFNAIVNIFGGI